jgi:hypothetical protein
MVTDWRLLQPKAHRYRDVVAGKRRRIHDLHRPLILAAMRRAADACR